MKNRIALSSIVILSLLLPCGNALAVDGVVLIDQARAMAGNITPGDTPGFPVSITQPGSYRLSGNLTAPANTNGIEISASEVTLDLNGFRMVGSGIGLAIGDTGAHDRIAIFNGTISGFGSGINLLQSDHVIVHDIRDTCQSSVSIVLGQYATVQRNSVQGLIQASCPSVITENVTEGFLTVVIVGVGGPQCVRWNNRSLGFTGDVTQ